MLIDLPKKFRYQNSAKDLAEVVDGSLILHSNTLTSFKKIMKIISLRLHGGESCYYCGCFLKPKKLTMDHLYPQDLGGPTISSNLVPTCKKCNNEKTNLTECQYKSLLKVPKGKHRSILRKELIHAQSKLRKLHKYSVPVEWIEYHSTSAFLVRVEIGKKYKGEKYTKIKDFYQEYGYLPKPVVVDCNYVLLDGFTTLMFAKEEGIRTVPIIRLENVEVQF